MLEHIHGHIGWLCVAALLHPAILLRRPKRRAPLAVTLTTLFVLVAGGLGATIYPCYRMQLKQALFRHAPRLGWCFERKEHLAVGAIGFAVIGCLTHLSVRKFDDDGTRELLARCAHRSFIVSFTFALMVAVLGVSVASYSTF